MAVDDGGMHYVNGALYQNSAGKVSFFVFIEASFKRRLKSYFLVVDVEKVSQNYVTTKGSDGTTAF